jgi:hypothetical protein
MSLKFPKIIYHTFNSKYYCKEYCSNPDVSINWNSRKWQYLIGPQKIILTLGMHSSLIAECFDAKTRHILLGKYSTAEYYHNNKSQVL